MTIPRTLTVLHTPNTGPKLKEVWAFISRDGDGKENVIAGNIGVLGMTPLMTGNPKTFEIFRAIVDTARAELEAHGQTIHLVRFSNREEITDWRI